MLRILTVLLVLPSTAALAEWSAPQGEDLKRFVAGKTVHLDTPLGALPITYNANGTLNAHAGSLALSAYLGSKADRGRWSVKGDKVCQKFLKWFSGEMSCLQIKAQGRRISWRRDDGMTGTALLAQNDAAPPRPPSGLGVALAPEPPKTWAAASASPTVSSPKKSGHALKHNAITRADADGSWKVAAITPTKVTDAVESEPQLIEPLIEVKRWRTVARPGSGTVGAPSGHHAPTAHVKAPVVGEIDAGGFLWQSLAAQIIRQRADHLWCQRLSGGGAAADDIPPLLRIAGARTPDGSIGEAGCLAPSPSITEVARSLVMAIPQE